MTRRGLFVACFLATRGALAQTYPGQDEIFQPPPEPAPAPQEPPPAPPSAAEPAFRRFGAQGLFVISGGTSIGVSSTQYDSTDASSMTAGFSPAVDYFFIDNVSIGLDATLAYSDGKGYGADSSLIEISRTTLSAGPRFGVNVPLGDVFSLYPRLTLGVESVHEQQRLLAGKSLSSAASAIGTDKSTQTGPWIALSLPLLVHPVPHFFFGPGVTVFHEFARAQEGPDIGGQRTSITGSLLLGGYFSVVPEPKAASDPMQAFPVRRFGDARQLVVSNETSIAASYLTHAGTDTTSTGLTLAPAFDYFVARHVSIGLEVAVRYSRVSGIDPTTQAGVTTTNSSVSAGPRLGFDLPVSDFVSIRPIVSLDLGSGSADEESGVNADKYTYTFVTAAGSAWLLLHPTSHLFLGLGPQIAHDLSHTNSFRTVDKDNLATRVGAAFTLGAWF